MAVMNAHETFESPIRSSTAAIHQQIGLSKRAQKQPVGWFSTNELPVSEPSIAIAGRISSKLRAPERILQQRTSNSLKRFANCELTRNRVFDDEYRSAGLAAAG